MATIQDYDQEIQKNPNNAEAYCKRGMAYGDEGEDDKALADFNQAIKINPNYAKAYCSRGMVYFNLDECDQAIEDFKQMLRIDPHNAEAYRLLGDAYMSRGIENNKISIGDQTLAINQYDKAISINPKNALAYMGRGMAYGHINKDERGIIDLEAALNLGLEDEYDKMTRTFLTASIKKIIAKKKLTALAPKITNIMEQYGYDEAKLQEEKKQNPKSLNIFITTIIAMIIGAIIGYNMMKINFEEYELLSGFIFIVSIIVCAVAGSKIFDILGGIIGGVIGFGLCFLILIGGFLLIIAFAILVGAIGFIITFKKDEPKDVSPPSPISPRQRERYERMYRDLKRR
jgi:tetratricopeptide (TPR) repeat protein